MATAAQIVELKAAGYSVHHGDHEDGPRAGRWWWIRVAPAVAKVDADDRHHATAGEAWDAAIIAHVSELMEP